MASAKQQLRDVDAHFGSVGGTVELACRLELPASREPFLGTVWRVRYVVKNATGGACLRGLRPCEVCSRVEGPLQ